MLDMQQQLQWYELDILIRYCSYDDVFCFNKWRENWHPLQDCNGSVWKESLLQRSWGTLVSVQHSQFSPGSSSNVKTLPFTLFVYFKTFWKYFNIHLRRIADFRTFKNLYVWGKINDLKNTYFHLIWILYLLELLIFTLKCIINKYGILTFFLFKGNLWIQ